MSRNTVTTDKQIFNAVSLQQTQKLFEVGGQFDHRDMPASEVVQASPDAAPFTSASTRGASLRQPLQMSHTS